MRLLYLFAFLIGFAIPFFIPQQASSNIYSNCDTETRVMKVLESVDENVIIFLDDVQGALQVKGGQVVLLANVETGTRSIVHFDPDILPEGVGCLVLWGGGFTPDSIQTIVPPEMSLEGDDL